MTVYVGVRSNRGPGCLSSTSCIRAGTVKSAHWREETRRVSNGGAEKKEEEPQSCTAMKQRGGGRHGNRRFLSRQTVAACGGSGSKEVWFSYITELCLGSRSAAALCCLGAGCNQTVPLLCVCFFCLLCFSGGDAEVRPAGGVWGVWGVRLPQSHQQPRKHAEEAS